MPIDPETRINNTNKLLAFLKSPPGRVSAEEDLAGVKMLIDQGANVNGLGGFDLPIITACSGWCHRVEVAEYLTSVKGFDYKAVNDEGESFLATGIGQGFYVGILKLQNIKNIITNIAKNSGEEAVNYLLNCKDAQGRTLLHRACESGRADVAEYLISIGANVNAVDNNGRNALMLALSQEGQFGLVGLQSDSVALIDRLIGDMENINHVDSEGKSALSYACKIGNARIVDRLFARGAVCNFVDNQGNPPLFYLSKFSMYQSFNGPEIILSFFGHGSRRVGRKVGKGENIGMEKGRLRLNEFYGPSTVDALFDVEGLFARDPKRFTLEKKVTKLIEDSQVSAIISSFVNNGYDFSMTGREGKNVLMLIDGGYGANPQLVDKMIKLGASKYLLPSNVPKYYTDQSEFENIACPMVGCEWSPFVEGILLAVANKDAAFYPKAVKNDDGTVSIFTDAIEGVVTGDQDFIEEGREGDPQGNLIRGAQKEFIVEQMNYLADKMGFLTPDGAPVVIFDNSGAVPEVKFNLNPEQLDAIFKQNSKYSGYRGNVSFLSLNEQVKVKDGKIMLMPFFETQEGGIVMSAGCEFTEIPTLQLMRLLPNYESDILPIHDREGFRFHWVPGEVGQSLGIDRCDVAKSISRLFAKKGVKFIFEGSEEVPDSFKSSELPGDSVVDIDEVSRDFYMRYGNCSADMLESGSMKSLEVDAVDFLEASKEVVFEKGPHKFKALHLGNIDVMILKERSKKLSSPELVASGADAASRLTASVEFGSSSSPAFRIDSKPPGVVKPIEYKSFDASKVRSVGYVLKY